jgi:hypothetical protein
MCLADARCNLPDRVDVALAILTQMTRLDWADDEEALSATLRVIDANEVVKLAGKILDLYTTIATTYVDRR